MVGRMELATGTWNDPSGHQIRSTDGQLLLMNVDYPINEGFNSDMRNVFGLPSGNNPYWNPQGRNDNSDNVPVGTVLRIEFVTYDHIYLVNMESCLRDLETKVKKLAKTYGLKIKGFECWLGDEVVNYPVPSKQYAGFHVVLYVMGTDPINLRRLQMRTGNDGIMLRSFTAGISEVQDSALRLPEANDIMNFEESSWWNRWSNWDTYASKKRLLSNKRHKSQEDAIKKMFVNRPSGGGEPPGKSIYVLDLRHNMEKMESIYNVEGIGPSGGGRDTRKAFDQAFGNSADRYANPLLKRSYQYDQDYNKFRIQRYLYNSYSAHRTPWDSGVEEGIAPTVKFVKYDLWEFNGNSIPDLIGAFPNATRMVISLEGFNNGDGTKETRASGNSSIRVSSDDQGGSTSNQLLLAYWPRLQTILNDKGITAQNTIVLNVWWSGTYLEYIYCIKRTGALFNVDYCSAHITGRHALYNFVKQLSQAPGIQRMPITIIAESTGARVGTSLIERINENPLDQTTFGETGRFPISMVLAHPALRNLDVRTDWKDDNHRVEDDPDISVEQRNNPPFLYGSSPLLREWDLLLNGTKPRLMIQYSPFDKAGLAFAYAQAYNPLSCKNGSPVIDANCIMLGRRGLPTALESSEKAKIPTFFSGGESGSIDPLRADFWHVDLMGWNLANEVFHSRSLFTNNIGDDDFPCESRFWDSWALSDFMGALRVSTVVGQPSWNYLKMNPERIEGTWQRITNFITNEGSVAP